VRIGWAGIALLACAGLGCTQAAVEEDPARTAFAERRSDVWLTVEGELVRVLPDDRRSPRHQRFVLETPTGQTILVVHNVDVAPRVTVRPGDELEVRGLYVWNPQGGLIHFTHRSAGPGEGGWIR
jgi:hypothetical protein